MSYLLLTVGKKKQLHAGKKDDDEKRVAVDSYAGYDNIEDDFM